MQCRVSRGCVNHVNAAHPPLTVLSSARPHGGQAGASGGTLAVDLAGAVLITSLARARLGWRAWRAVHWLAYLAWPAAFAHSLLAGTDLRIWWVALIEYGSAALVAAAVATRLLAGRPHRPAGAVIRRAAAE